MEMFNVLFLNRKGGVGKTTIVDELVYSLRRKGKIVEFRTMDQQGGSAHEESEVEEGQFRIIDTPGGDGALLEALQLADQVDLVVIPVLPTTAELEPTLLTFKLLNGVAPDVDRVVVINQYDPRGVLDKQVYAALEGEDFEIIGTIPRAKAISRAKGAGKSVAEYQPKNPSVAAFDNLADYIIKKSEERS